MRDLRLNHLRLLQLMAIVGSAMLLPFWALCDLRRIVIVIQSVSFPPTLTIKLKESVRIMSLCFQTFHCFTEVTLLFHVEFLEVTKERKKGMECHNLVCCGACAGC